GFRDALDALTARNRRGQNFRLVKRRPNSVGTCRNAVFSFEIHVLTHLSQTMAQARFGIFSHHHNCVNFVVTIWGDGAKKWARRQIYRLHRPTVKRSFKYRVVSNGLIPSKATDSSNRRTACKGTFFYTSLASDNLVSNWHKKAHAWCV